MRPRPGSGLWEMLEARESGGERERDNEIAREREKMLEVLER